MGLTAAIFLVALLSGFAFYHLRRASRRGDRAGPMLQRAGTVLAWFWLALSALLFAWAAARHFD